MRISAAFSLRFRSNSDSSVRNPALFWQRIRTLLAVVMASLMALPVAVQADDIWRQYTPSVGHWEPAGLLKQERQAPRSVKLASGKVLTIGGQVPGQDGQYEVVLNSAEVYNPETDHWHRVASLKSARAGFSANLLKTGASVLVSGGYIRDSLLKKSYFATTEWFNPATEIWWVGPSLLRPRAGHIAVSLNSDKVLVAGGVVIENGVEVYTASAEILDDHPAFGSWEPAPPMNTARASAEATLLFGGRVLVTGGWNPDTGALASAEIYDPKTNSWSYAADMPAARVGHQTVRLRDGTVLVAGGSQGRKLDFPYAYPFSGCCFIDTAIIDATNYNWYDIQRDAFRYHPKTDTWTRAGYTRWAGYGAALALLENGHVISSGGCCIQSSIGGEDGELKEQRNQEIQGVDAYNPYTNLWSPVDDMYIRRNAHSMVVLDSGRVLLFGGGSWFGLDLRTSLLFDLEKPADVSGSNP